MSNTYTTRPARDGNGFHIVKQGGWKSHGMFPASKIDAELKRLNMRDFNEKKALLNKANTYPMGRYNSRKTAPRESWAIPKEDIDSWRLRKFTHRNMTDMINSMCVEYGKSSYTVRLAFRKQLPELVSKDVLWDGK
jgi:hypothetical protein